MRPLAEAPPVATIPAPGRSGSCRNETGPWPKRLLSQRYRPPAEAVPAATISAPGRSGSCRNDTGPRPKRFLPKRIRPPAEAAPAEANSGPRPKRLLPNSGPRPKRLLPNSHPSRAGQIPPFRVARSRTGKVPTVGLQSGADLRGTRGDSLVSERARFQPSGQRGVGLGRSRRSDSSLAWTSAEPEGIRWSLSVPDEKGSPVHGEPLARNRTPRRRGSGYSERASVTRGVLFTGEGGQKPHAQAATGRRVF